MRILQILANLLNNGIKYANLDREKPFVELETRDLEADKIEISVSDNGLGHTQRIAI